MIVRILTRLPAGAPRTWYAPSRTVVAAALVDTGAAVAVTGPPGPAGPPGGGLTGGDGVSIVGADIRLNIDELPLAPSS